MSSYIGKHAEYYDIIYQDKAYQEEAAFIQECLERYGDLKKSKLLELACGTGRHALELEKQGHRIWATDYSEDLLNIARKRGRDAKSSVVFELADMRELSLDEKGFEAAICLFDSIGYVQTDEAIGKVLDGLKEHLLPNALFLFEFWHAEAMLAHYEPTRVRKWRLDDGNLLRISRTELVPDKNLAQVAYELFELRNDLTYSMIKETQVNRFFHVEEMGELLKRSGFEALAWLNGYTWNEEINDECWHVLCVARLQ